jgi:hypothetical protein
MAHTSVDPSHASEEPETPQDPMQLMREIHGLLEIVPFDDLPLLYRLLWRLTRVSHARTERGYPEVVGKTDNYKFPGAP